jgi:hypothetical protein
MPKNPSWGLAPEINVNDGQFTVHTPHGKLVINVKSVEDKVEKVTFSFTAGGSFDITTERLSKRVDDRHVLRDAHFVIRTYRRERHIR